jgi:hypothetical protein
VAEAQAAVLVRMGSGPFEVRNPATYGTAVIKSVVRLTLQGWTRARIILEAVTAEASVVSSREDRVEDRVLEAVGGGNSALDEFRVIIDGMQNPARPWLTGAALAFVTLATGPDRLPEWVPQPRAGATTTQARGWAALWFAGLTDLFPDGDGDPDHRRRRRSRYVKNVLDHLRAAAEQYLVQRRAWSDA